MSDDDLDLVHIGHHREMTLRVPRILATCEDRPSWR